MNYYVYVFFDGQKPIYVGYGKNMRWKDHFSMKTNVRLNRFLKNNPVNQPVIAADNLSIGDAKVLEIKLIAQYGRDNLKTGSLYNLTDGGEGTSGLIMTEDQKLKIKQGADKRWSKEINRKAQSEIMKAASNTEEFKVKVINRRDPNWIPFTLKLSRDRQNIKMSKLEKVKEAFYINDLPKMLLVSGIKTENGLKRYLRRHGVIEK